MEIENTSPPGGRKAPRCGKGRLARRPRSLPALFDVSPRPAGLGGLLVGNVPGGCRGPGPARCASKKRTLHDTSALHRGASTYQGVDDRAREDGACLQRVFCKPETPVPEPAHRLACDPQIRRPAGLELPTHPHQLWHACGFALANQGADTQLIQDYLGHRDYSAYRHLHGGKSIQV